MKKKILALCLVVVLAVTAVTGATLAYFTDDDAATNTITVGNVQIDLTEPNWEGEGSKDAPEVYPGEALAKDPTVTNTGANPCFVRVKVTGLDCLGADNMITLRTDYEDGKLGDNWVEYNGYYYYTKVLPVDDPETDAKENVTDALFDQIVIPTTLTNENGTEFAESYDIDIVAEAVQAQGAKAPNWAAVQTMTVAEIAAWFNTCGMDAAE